MKILSINPQGYCNGTMPAVLIAPTPDKMLRTQTVSVNPGAAGWR